MHTTLLIDTAFETAQIALVHGDQCVAHQARESGGAHDRILAGLARDVLGDTDLATLQKIFVTTGPGRFTGLRVGIAFARGLGLVHQTPVIGISTVDLFNITLKRLYPDHPSAILISVKRGESFVQWTDETTLHRVNDDQLYSFLTQRNAALYIGGFLSAETLELLQKGFEQKLFHRAAMKDMPDIEDFIRLINSPDATQFFHPPRPYYGAEG